MFEKDHPGTNPEWSFRLYPLRTADKLLTNLCKNKKQTPQTTYLRSLMELVTGLEPATCSLRMKLQRAKQRIYYSLWGVNYHKSNAVADNLLTGRLYFQKFDSTVQFIHGLMDIVL